MKLGRISPEHGQLMRGERGVSRGEKYNSYTRNNKYNTDVFMFSASVFAICEKAM